MTTQLTDEQIRNWRRVMVSVIGPYALVMSKEEIQLLKDRMQAKANEIEADKRITGPSSGPSEMGE